MSAPPGTPADTAPATPRAARQFRLSPRMSVLVVSGVSALVLAVVIAALPVPYVIFSPGPVRDTLGTQKDGEDLIHIEGAPTYETSGTLDLTTISVTGGPLGPLSITDVVEAWLDPTRSVRPVDTVYPPERSREEAEQESADEMQSAQQSAAVAALTAAGFTVPAELVIGEVDTTVPAAEVLRAGDVVVEFDGTAVAGSGELIDLVSARSPGDVVPMVIERDGDLVDADVALAEGGGRTIIGVVLQPRYELPFEVTYDVGGIGGPSAGLMFSLGIYDKITDGELTGGEEIAGTGTISDDGSVGPIDGIQQKMVGASRAGADWFLVPADNCQDAAGAVPDGLRDVVVTDFADARDAVETIGEGRGDSLPHCSG